MADRREVDNTYRRGHEASFARGLSGRALRLLGCFGVEAKGYLLRDEGDVDIIGTTLHSYERGLGAGAIASLSITRESVQPYFTSRITEILARLTPTGIGFVSKVTLDCRTEDGLVRSVGMTRDQYGGAFPVAYQDSTLGPNATYQDKKGSFAAMLKKMEAKAAGR